MKNFVDMEKWEREVCAILNNQGEILVTENAVSFDNTKDNRYATRCALVKKDFTARWTNPIGDGQTVTTTVDYKEGDILSLNSWRPEGFTDVRRALYNIRNEPTEQNPQMVCFWGELEKNCVLVEIVNF